MLATTLFWVAFALLLYTYAGYPLLMRLRAARLPRAAAGGGEARAAALPRVTVIVAAHQEGARIEERLRNLLDLDYPADRLSILIASDGSTDDTVARARAIRAPGVRVIAFHRRRGKPAMLNPLIVGCMDPIVVLADARQSFDRGALRALVAPFADPTVGAVSGELVLVDAPRSTPVGDGIGIYWRREVSLREAESRVDSVVGATGAIWALRPSLFEPIPEDTLLDDVLIPMRITQRGYRVLFEPRARAFDHKPASARHEFARKVRTIAGNFQLLARERWLLDPRANRLFLATLSHKALRLAGPILFAVILIANLALAHRPFYAATLMLQAAFYAAALLGAGAGRSTRRRPWLAVPHVVCLLNAATVAGFVRFLTGRQAVTWEGTSGPSPSHAAEFPAR